jgi:hypothetical protein
VHKSEVRLLLCWRGFCRSGWRVAQHRSIAVRTLGGKYGKRDRGKHENDSCPGRGLGEHGSGRASAEGGLAAHASEGGGDIAALAALQQHDNDKKRANEDVNSGDQGNHVIFNLSSGERLAAHSAFAENLRTSMH